MARVRVPQADGEIVISDSGDDPVTYKVSDHTVTVKDADLPRFLVLVEGAKTGGNPASRTAASTA